MWRLEKGRGAAKVFWDITQKGTACIIRHGVVGTEGQTELIRFDSPKEAFLGLRKLHSGKQKEGYAAPDTRDLPDLNIWKSRFREIAANRLLKDCHGPLPKGTITVQKMDGNTDQDGITLPQQASVVDSNDNIEIPRWPDMRNQLDGEASIELMHIWPCSWEEVWNPILRFSDEIKDLLTSQNAPERIVRDVPFDFRILLTWKALGSPASRIVREMYAAYEAGGFPCGWNGRYPEGNLIVYWPFDREPEYMQDDH